MLYLSIIIWVFTLYIHTFGIPIVISSEELIDPKIHMWQLSIFCHRPHIHIIERTDLKLYSTNILNEQNYFCYMTGV